ncbi:MAG TPA: hypothetical protein VND92_08010 [Vicinamibacterales bacterium]|nr:hypothetical protein [Vicinamibacterales bacterium]
MAETILAHFKTPAAFRAWLRKHHKTAGSLVLRISRNHAAERGVTYAQALDEALCSGASIPIGPLKRPARTT